MNFYQWMYTFRVLNLIGLVFNLVALAMGFSIVAHWKDDAVIVNFICMILSVFSIGYYVYWFAIQ